MSQSNSKRALVTGGAGFLGSHLVRRLCESGWTVFVTSRSEKSPMAGETWLQGDPSNNDDCQRFIKQSNPAIIYHFAGPTGASQDLELVEPHLHGHLLSTVNLLRAIADGRQTRFILPASCLEPEGDIATAVPTSPYAAARTASTLYAAMFAQVFGVHAVMARVFVAFGPGQQQSKLLPYVIASLARGEQPRISSGAWQADWIYVDDAIDALELCATAPGLAGKVVEIGTGRLTPSKKVIDMLVDVMGSSIKPDFGSVPDRQAEPSRVADVHATRSVLGWAPRISLLDGLRRTADWYSGKA